MKIPNPFAKKTIEGQGVTLADATAVIHGEAKVAKEKHALATEWGEPQEITVGDEKFLIRDDGSSREMRPV